MNPEPRLQRWETHRVAAGYCRRRLPRRVLGAGPSPTTRALRRRPCGLSPLSRGRCLSSTTSCAWSFATDRTRWFFRHLLDLAVVALPFLRPLRLLRLLVLVGALQRAIGGAIRGRVVIYTAFSVVLLIYVASLAILDTERSQPGSRSPPLVMRSGGRSPR